MSSEWDVVIVGSGLSGLTAAYRLFQAKKDLRVLMVEAQDYFGGRTRSLDLEKYKSEVSVGGTFALFEHHDTLDLAREIDCYPEDKLDPKTVNFSQFSKEFVSVTGTTMGLPLFLYLLYKGSKIVDAKTGVIDFSCKTAKKLDKMSLEQWIKKYGLLNSNFTREFFYLLETYPDLHRVSALQCAIAAFVRFRGIPHNGIEIPPQVLRWEGGTGVFTRALIDRLGKFEHFQLQLNTRVKLISQASLDQPSAVKVTLESSVGKSSEVSTKYVIVATSPKASAPASMGGTINYVPALEPEAAEIFAATEPTPTVSYNILVIYKKPWWVEQKVGTFILPPYYNHVNQTGVWGNVVDGTVKGDNKPGIIRVFCDSSRVEGWSVDQIKQSTLIFLKQMFPKQKDLVDSKDLLEEIIIHDWNKAKPAIPGVTYTWPPTGVLSRCGHALKEPHGSVHFAGSERSVWGAGWMEGAVQRGNDTAQEILRASGWASKNYAVRTAGLPKTMMLLATPSDDDVESTPNALPSEPSLLDLTSTLQPNPRKPLGIDGLIEHLESTGPSEDAEPERLKFTAHQCLEALKDLQALKQKKEHKVTGVPAFTSSSSSSSSSSSASFAGDVETELPLGFPREKTAQQPVRVTDTPTVIHPSTPTPELVRSIAVPSFFAGLAVGVAVTVFAFRVRAQQS